METYRRQIKFCYYKVVEIEINSDRNSHVVGNFNLVEWLMRMEEEGMVKHNIELSDCTVNLEQFCKFEDKNIYAIRAYKLRDANIPSKVKEGEDAIPIPLESDEYIGEDLNFLYDRDRSICMIQQNRMSIGISRLVEWINKFCSKEDKAIAMIPILNTFDSNGLERKSVRSIEFTFANSELKDGNGSLRSIINSFKGYKGATGKITLTVGREKNAELDKKCIVDLVNDIQANPGVINGAKIKVKEQSILDDDKSRIEIVDLFENSVHDYIAFDIEKRKPLDFNRARSNMLKKYKDRQDLLERLCAQ